MSEELKPCPFCGSTDIYHEYNETTGCYELGCNQCGAWPYQEGRKDDVVRKWNRRVGRICRNVDEGQEFTCSECGARYHILSQGEPTEQWAHVRRPGHCPNCGAKVVKP